MRELTANSWARRIVLGVATVMAPFLIPIAWASILGYATWPLYVRLKALLRGRRTLAASVLTVAVALSVVLPLLWLVMLLRTEAAGVADTLMVAMRDGRIKTPAWLAALPLVGADVGRNVDTLLADPTHLKTELLLWVRQLDQEGMSPLGERADG